jgi:acetoin utilization deacetylase AcuC-like enzyme
LHKFYNILKEGDKMFIVYPESHESHEPPFEIFNGEQTPHNEVPARVDRILSAVRTAGYQPKAVQHTLDRQILEQVHAPAYVRFLEERSRVLSTDTYQYPSVFRYRAGRETQHPIGQLGNFSFDMYTPLHHQAFHAAWDSAAAAAEVATRILNQELTVGYALCRPPGHHAEYDQMGGYCYLNNAAVAAQVLAAHGRVATIDIDFHHGNGTQHIFYENDHVFTTSIHAHPDWKFPYFSGYEDEIGTGRGRGCNVNRALQEGTSNEQYHQVLLEVIEHIRQFNPEFLVISLGLDTHVDDPIGGFALTTPYYTRIAQTLSQLDLPTVIVQEGGYNTDLLGTNVVSFLQGFAHT